MFNEYVTIVLLYKKEASRFFKKAKKEEKLILKYEWEHEILDKSIFFEIELLSSEIAGYASSLEKGNFTRCEETLTSLSVKSIYDNEVILNWLTLENITKYPDYYVYILFLENYRSLVVKVCEEMREEGENKTGKGA